MSDEAYYSLYGEQLAWGYFDHPPMVGLMTYLSSKLFSGNLSVRFLTVVFQLITLTVIWRIIGEKTPTKKKVILFFTIAASLVMFEAYGFVTTPDVPFLLFTALFLRAYQLFLIKESWKNTGFLALTMAGMMYSKYHGVLVVGLVVLSNWKLLTKSKFWLAPRAV
ncbi:hypothetical protein FACS1894162_8890 [Bacteroidia bacterium]|nr:hypothetical protein FACS1894162_8890 [Bacteroidia bacterium]